MPELMTLAEIAAVLSMPLDTVRRWHHRGDIKAEQFRIGRNVRYTRAGVAEWIAGMQVTPT